MRDSLSAPAVGYVPYVGYLPNAEYASTPVQSDLKDENGVWAHLDDQLDSFVSGTGKRVDIYVLSTRPPGFLGTTSGSPLMNLAGLLSKADWREKRQCMTTASSLSTSPSCQLSVAWEEADVSTRSWRRPFAVCCGRVAGDEVLLRARSEWSPTPVPYRRLGLSDSTNRSCRDLASSVGTCARRSRETPQLTTDRVPGVTHIAVAYLVIQSTMDSALTVGWRLAPEVPV